MLVCKKTNFNGGRTSVEQVEIFNKQTCSAAGTNIDAEGQCWKIPLEDAYQFKNKVIHELYKQDFIKSNKEK